MTGRASKRIHHPKKGPHERAVPGLSSHFPVADSSHGSPCSKLQKLCSYFQLLLPTSTHSHPSFVFRRIFDEPRLAKRVTNFEETLESSQTYSDETVLESIHQKFLG